MLQERAQVGEGQHPDPQGSVPAADTDAGSGRLQSKLPVLG